LSFLSQLFRKTNRGFRFDDSLKTFLVCSSAQLTGL